MTPDTDPLLAIMETYVTAFEAGKSSAEQAAATARREAESKDALIGDLAMLVRRLTYRVKKHYQNVVDIKLADQANEFLRKHELAGSCLREDGALIDQPPKGGHE